MLEPLSEEELRDLAQRCSAFSVRGEEEFYSPEKHDSGLFLIQGRSRKFVSKRLFRSYLRSSDF